MEKITFVNNDLKAIINLNFAKFFSTAAKSKRKEMLKNLITIFNCDIDYLNDLFRKQEDYATDIHCYKESINILNSFRKKEKKDSVIKKMQEYKSLPKYLFNSEQSSYMLTSKLFVKYSLPGVQENCDFVYESCLKKYNKALDLFAGQEFFDLSLPVKINRQAIFNIDLCLFPADFAFFVDRKKTVSCKIVKNYNGSYLYVKQEKIELIAASTIESINDIIIKLI